MGICCLPIIDINSYAIIGKIIIKLKLFLIYIYAIIGQIIIQLKFFDLKVTMDYFFFVLKEF